MRIPTWIGIVGSLGLILAGPLLVLVLTTPGESVDRELFKRTLKYSLLVAGVGVFYFVSVRPF